MNKLFLPLGLIVSLSFAGAAMAGLPQGWVKAHLDSDWMMSSKNPTDVCNELAKTKFVGRNFEIISTSESQQWIEPQLEVTDRYKYHCDAVVGPKN